MGGQGSFMHIWRQDHKYFFVFWFLKGNSERMIFITLALLNLAMAAALFTSANTLTLKNVYIDCVTCTLIRQLLVRIQHFLSCLTNNQLLLASRWTASVCRTAFNSL